MTLKRSATRRRNFEEKIHGTPSHYVAKKAEEAGTTTIQLEERVVPDYGLVEGAKTVAFDNYSLEIRVDGPGRVTQTWLTLDGRRSPSRN